MMWLKWRGFLLGALISVFYRLYRRLWRIERVRAPLCLQGPEPKVYAHWHGDELVLLGTEAKLGLTVMASFSRDGDLMKRVLESLGYFVVRGSSSRGAVGGLKGLMDAVLEKGKSAALAVDGPRGPIYRVKPGVLKLAQRTGCLLVPGAAAASRRFVFKKAWNRCYLPLPFAKCVIVYGEPFRVPASLTDAQFETVRQGLELQMQNLKAEAESRFSRVPEGLPKLI